MSSEIQAAFFGVIARDAELRVSRSGAAFLQFDVRVGDDDPNFIRVRSSRSGTIAEADRFTVGALVFCEGTLFVNRKTAPEGAPKIEIDVLARHLRIVALARHLSASTARPAEDLARTAVDSAEAAP
jgi:hypothetical protein